MGIAGPFLSSRRVRFVHVVGCSCCPVLLACLLAGEGSPPLPSSVIKGEAKQAKTRPAGLCKTCCCYLHRLMQRKERRGHRLPMDGEREGERN